MPRHDAMRTRFLHFLRFGLGSAFALVVAGCATDSNVPADAAAVTSRFSAIALQAQRENSFQSTWRGRTYEALIESYGAPKMMMNVPGHRPLKTSLVVYGVIDKTANCVDAFTMVKQEQTEQWTVADYFCR